MGEMGSDIGGLTREFFTLFKHGMTMYMEETGSFKHNLVAYQVFLCNTVLTCYFT